METISPELHAKLKVRLVIGPQTDTPVTCDIGTDEQMTELRRVAPEMLEEWSRTRKAPRHAAWLHEKIAAEAGEP